MAPLDVIKSLLSRYGSALVCLRHLTDLRAQLCVAERRERWNLASSPSSKTIELKPKVGRSIRFLFIRSFLRNGACRSLVNSPSAARTGDRASALNHWKTRFGDPRRAWRYHPPLPACTEPGPGPNEYRAIPIWRASCARVLKLQEPIARQWPSRDRRSPCRDGRRCDCRRR